MVLNTRQRRLRTSKAIAEVVAALKARDLEAQVDSADIITLRTSEGDRARIIVIVNALPEDGGPRTG